MHPSAFSLIPAKEEDLEYALDCLVEAFIENYASALGPEKNREQIREECRYYMNPHATSGIRSFLAPARERPPHDIFLAKEADAGRSGCMILGVNTEAGPDVAWVYLLFVEREHRRKGLGKLMLAKTEEWARDHGMKAIMLSVKTHNEAAMALYGSFGLKPCKMWLRKAL